MRCPSCGRENADSAAQCAHCGAELRESLLSRLSHWLHRPPGDTKPAARQPITPDEEPQGIEMTFEPAPAAPHSAGKAGATFAEQELLEEPQPSPDSVPEVVGGIEGEPLTQLAREPEKSDHDRRREALEAEVDAAIDALVENVEMLRGRGPASADGKPQLHLSVGPSSPIPAPKPPSGKPCFADRPITEEQSES